jgi:glycosyltransferase involved in cell wall biosynthesis
LAKSSDLPHIVLVGGCGLPSGVPRHLLHLAKVLRGRAHVTLLAEADQGGYSQARALGADHIVVPNLASRLSFRHVIQGWRGLFRALSRNSGDLVWIHARLPVVMGRVALALRLWRPRCPVFFTLHGLPFGRGHRRMISFISKCLEKLLLRCAPPLHLVFLSPAQVQQMQDHIGATSLRRHHIHVLPNCSDLGTVPPRTTSDAPCLVMTGRAGWQKDYHLATRLFAAMPAQCQLLLCGAGTDSPAFQKDIARRIPRSAFERITFAGPVHDIGPILAQADLYLSTSRYEGLPIGVLEAYEAGLPIALRDFEGARDLVKHHSFGMILPMQDLSGEAAQILRLIATFQSDLPLHRRAVQSRWAQLWSPDIFEQRVIDLLHKNGILNDLLPRPDCNRDAPAPHQYHHRTPVSRAPTPPPSYTTAAPSLPNA